VALVIAIVVAVVQPASADSYNGDTTTHTTVSGTQTDDGGAAFVDSVIGRRGRESHRGTGSGITCTYRSLNVGESTGDDFAEGMTVLRICVDSAGAVTGTDLVTLAARSPRAQALLAVGRAVAAVSIDLPVADSSPADHVTIPNIATWFWVTNKEPFTATASEGGVAATVRAQFAGATFDAGGQSVTCADGGRAYDLKLPDDRQSSHCVIRFVPPARHIDVDVTATWHLTWTATNGESGDLGDVERTATIPLDVHELHTVIRNR
jgi:hypothetical protein